MDESAFEVPDFFAPAVGFKVLRYRMGLETLQSPYYSKFEWPTKKNAPMKALCAPGYKASEAATPHDPPAPEGAHTNIHPCGIYAQYHLGDLIGREKPRLLYDIADECYGAMVAVVLEGWGRVEAHESDQDGWRSEYARIAAMCRPVATPRVRDTKAVMRGLEAICYALDVPLLSRPDAEAYAEHIGVNLAPSKR